MVRVGIVRLAGVWGGKVCYMALNALLESIESINFAIRPGLTGSSVNKNVK